MTPKNRTFTESRIAVRRETGQLCAPHEWEAKGIGTVTHCYCKDCPMRDEIRLKQQRRKRAR
jgi:hypothetical protein